VCFEFDLPQQRLRHAMSHPLLWGWLLWLNAAEVLQSS
jgi:hypothetical protein